MARPSGPLKWTDGTEWVSGTVVLLVRLTMIMPTPPAAFTVALLAIRSLPPRSHSTILPATLAGSSWPAQHWATRAGLAPAAPTALDCTSGAGPTTAGDIEVPVNVRPSPSVTGAVNVRSSLPAAPVVTHGSGWFTTAPEEVRSALPAAAATNTPASAACRKASSTASLATVGSALLIE